MIDWNTPRERKHTPLDDAMERYREEFGEDYIVQYNLESDEYGGVVGAINHCIETGKKQELDTYESGLLY